MTDASVLFEPTRLGSLALRNRIAMGPMTRQVCPDGIPTEAVAAYYRARATGGVALVIAEAACIDHPAAIPYHDVPVLHGPALAAWRSVVDAVHAEGAAIAAQLWHAGSVRGEGSPPDPSVPACSPSGLRMPNAPPGRVTSERYIADVIAAYARAAAECRAIGFDAVELHGAHGYLIDQFLWDTLIRREDGRGGTAYGRLRFAREVVAACRAAVGPDYPLIIRLSQWKQRDYGARLWTSPAAMAEDLAGLVDAGVDCFHASTRLFWTPGFAGSSERTLAGWMRHLTGKPVIAVGGVGLDRDFLHPDSAKLRSFENAGVAGLERLIALLEAGEFDVVAVGRALIANRAWPHLVREGRADQLRDFDRAMLKVLA